MNQIAQITSDSLQTQNLLLEDGSSISLTLYFVPMQYLWLIQSLVYAPKNFTIQNMRICNSPNMLRQYKNQIPFGMACFSTANREPSLQQDFVSGASNLYLLSAAEVQEYEAYLSE
jgi:hypothetical protein